MSYVGGFRVPAGAINGIDFTYGGTPIAFNPANNSLFVGNAGRVAEISIPGPVNSSDPAAMPAASYLQQAFVDPTEGHLSQVSSSDVTLYGLLVQGNRLHGSVSIYYDATYSQRLSHFSRSLSLTQSSFSGWSQVWETGRSGLVSGWMSAVPPEWQAVLGGPAITGQCCIPIIGRTSLGPAAFAFNPAQVGQGTVPAHPLVYYPIDHATLGNWEGSNAMYSASTRIAGVAIIAGTRTALFVGSHGTGPFCYGDGTNDPSKADGVNVCYDPTDSNKGPHNYPYRYQVWAYDLNDFAAVKAGSKQPWDVQPYGVWPLTFPTSANQLLLGGVGYDAQTQTLYVSQRDANRGSFTSTPIIHAFKMSATPGAAPPPTASIVSRVTLAANKMAPQAVATPITFTAQPAGGVAPYQYKWLLFDGVASTFVTNWTASNQYVWTPTTGNPNYRVGVWVRSAGNTADALEATTSLPFAISTSAKTSSVTMTANRVAPQAPFTAITWTAVPVGGVAPHQYKWLVSDGTTSTVAAAWSATDTFTWTPSSANANYRVTVWVRSAGNTVDASEALTSSPFPIGGSTASGASSVALTANRVAPQPPGTAIAFTAVPSGGVAPHEYKWLVSDGAASTVGAGWSTRNTYTWTPSSSNANYRVTVWVRSAGNAADAAETSASTAFAIEAPRGSSGAPPVAPVSPVSPVSSVSLNANKSEPQAPGTPITWTAVPSGGTAPFLYKWLVFNESGWTIAATWSSSNTFTWTPTVANNGYLVGVWVKAASNPADHPESSLHKGFRISNATTATPTTPLRVTLSSNLRSPQSRGTTVQWTAAATGGTAPYEFRWIVFDGSTVVIGGSWTTASTFAWTPTTASWRYQVVVQARSRGNTGDPEATSGLLYTIR